MLHIIPLSSFCPPKFDVALKIYDRSLLNFDPMVILRATSILGGQKVDKRISDIYSLKQVYKFHLVKHTHDTCIVLLLFNNTLVNTQPRASLLMLTSK